MGISAMIGCITIITKLIASQFADDGGRKRMGLTLFSVDVCFRPANPSRASRTTSAKGNSSDSDNSCRVATDMVSYRSRCLIRDVDIACEASCPSDAGTRVALPPSRIKVKTDQIILLAFSFGFLGSRLFEYTLKRLAD